MHLQIWIILIGQGLLSRILHLLLVLLQDGLIDLHFRWCKSRGGDKFLGSSVKPELQKNLQREKVLYQSLVADEFPSKPEERLFEVVVRLGRDIIVLEVLLPVEGDGLSLHFSLLHVDFVAAEDDRNVLANADEIAWIRLMEGDRTESPLKTYDASWERSCT